MHANNELGTIQPIDEIAAVAREAGIPLHVDGVQAARQDSSQRTRVGRRPLQCQRPQDLRAERRGRTLRAKKQSNSPA